LTRKFSLLLAIVIVTVLVLSAPLAAFACDTGKTCPVKCVNDGKDKKVDTKCPPKVVKKEIRPGWGFGDKNHCHIGPLGLASKIKVK